MVKISCNPSADWCGFENPVKLTICNRRKHDDNVHHMVDAMSDDGIFILKSTKIARLL